MTQLFPPRRCRDHMRPSARVPTERCDYLSLELITLNVKSVDAETVRGVCVDIDGTCQVRGSATVGPRFLLYRTLETHPGISLLDERRFERGHA